ncbi:putative pilus assembly protein FilE [uncultured Agitococcus sp.]|uniref:putative pilus assembly protein FilE n=1 Tax=uncultured Agitococcus sp. TaxID=1506599 RepID=UPI00260EA879|nr:putative pilus assembly protein FilE [uncultured Agitococcus sp.]
MNNLVRLFSLVLLCASAVQAQERIYSTVDAQGRVQVIKSEAVDNTKQETDVNTPVKSVIQTPSKYELEGEQYIDSDTLIKQQSEQPAKKRFYYVPTGALGEKILEGEHKTVESTTTPQAPKQEIKFSPEYQIITKEALLSKWHNLSSYCQQTKRLKPSRLFKASNALWIDKSDFSANQPDKILSLEKNLLTAEVVRISSFANSQKKPKFYLPIIVFLDEQGCVLEGAWQYWSYAKAANDNQYSAVDGLLTLPTSSKYILLYPPDEQVKISLPLQNYGSLLIEK